MKTKSLTMLERVAYKKFLRGLTEMNKAAQCFGVARDMLRFQESEQAGFATMLNERAQRAEEALKNLVEDI